MGNNIWSKLRYLFFGDGEDEKEKHTHDDQKSMIKPDLQSQMTPKTNVKVKMKFEYPKSGPFRFPVISDHEHVGSDPLYYDHKTMNTYEKTFTSTIEIKEEHKEKKPVLKPKTGSKRFQVQEIPSPVFGFHPRTETKREAETITTTFTYLEPQSLDEGNVNERVEEELIREDEVIQEEMHVHHESQTVMDESYDREDIQETMKDIEPSDDESVLVNKEDQQNVQHDDSFSAISEQKLDDSFSKDHALDEETSMVKISEHVPNGNNDKVSKADDLTLIKKPIEISAQSKLDQEKQVTAKMNESSIKDEGEQKEQGLPVNVMMFEKDRIHMRSTSTAMFPSIQLLNIPDRIEMTDDDWVNEQEFLLNETFRNFHVKARVVAKTKGPSVTLFEVQVDPGVKVNKITNLSDNIKLSLAAADIRIEAPIPGKNTIGIEVPNKVSQPVLLREVIRNQAFTKSKSTLTVALGCDISGQAIVTDIQKMPHGLIAGATGSGKSVCINAMLISLLYKATPEEVRLLLIDPKMVELAPYNDLPHLVCPVITDVKEATLSLKWAVDEMEDRYKQFAERGVRDIQRFNEKYPEQKMPYIVIIIDELADLMMMSPHDVEDAICRIAQKARACGIHLILATQRPSVDVITGLIKANIPTRIAFSVSSQVDSRTILDTSGAERLLGRGDMLFMENGAQRLVRIQGNFVSDDEIERVTDFVRSKQKPDYLFQKEELTSFSEPSDVEDELFDEACEFVLSQGSASSSSLQRRFRIGFARAARLIDMMEARGIVSGQNGSKPRDVLLNKHEFQDRFN